MDLLLYVFVVLLVSFTPGPGIIYNILLSLNYGLGKTVFSISGMMLGFSLYGVGAFYLIGLLSSSSDFLNLVQLTGSIYVIYMGYSKVMSHKKPNLHGHMEKKVDYRFFMDGLFLSVSGPKPLIFFTSIMPPFIDFNKEILGQFILLTLLFLGTIFFANMFYSIAGMRVANKVKNSEKYIKRVNVWSGYFFMFLGVFLVYEVLSNYWMVEFTEMLF